MIKTKTFNRSVPGLLAGLESIFTELGYDDLIVDFSNLYIIFPSDGTKTLKLGYQNQISTGPQILLT
jgi:hypothetical protein